MITKEEALRAFTVLEPRASGFMVAKETIRQFIEQQPASTRSRGMITKEQAFDMVDRFLSNNMDDEEYAEYSDALDTIYRVQQQARTSAQVPEERTLTRAINYLSWDSKMGVADFVLARELQDAMLNQPQEG